MRSLTGEMDRFSCLSSLSTLAATRRVLASNPCSNMIAEFHELGPFFWQFGESGVSLRPILEVTVMPVVRTASRHRPLSRRTHRRGRP